MVSNIFLNSSFRSAGGNGTCCKTYSQYFGWPFFIFIPCHLYRSRSLSPLFIFLTFPYLREILNLL